MRRFFFSSFHFLHLLIGVNEIKIFCKKGMLFLLFISDKKKMFQKKKKKKKKKKNNLIEFFFLITLIQKSQSKEGDQKPSHCMVRSHLQ